MPKMPGPLHVRSHLEWVLTTCEEMLERDGKLDRGLRLPPIDRDNLNKLIFYTKAILRKHNEKTAKTGQRKDIYVEAPLKLVH